MQIWIEVTNSSGVRYGDGPIITATGWKYTRGLDTVGRFSFSMPAADPMAQWIKNKRYAHCWGAPDDANGWPGGLQDLGEGIIEQIELQIEPSGAEMLSISGSDLLSELANVTVGDLDLFYDEVRAPDEVKKVPTSGASVVWHPGDTIDLVGGENRSYIYVYDDDEFIGVTFNVGSPVNTKSATLLAQYFNEDSSPQGWEELLLTDGTRSAGKPFAVDGTVTFEPPGGWGKTVYGKYIVRFYCVTANLDPVQFNTISIIVRQPTATALADTMALAPAGWSLDPEGKLETIKTVYLRMNKESVLATLGRIAEQVGEHFMLSPTGRRVFWIGTDKTDSNLRAIGPADPGTEPDDFTLYIRNLQRTLDSYLLFTRIYASGGGVGNERITLSDATNTAPAGCTMNAGEGWLQIDAAVAEYGRIDNPADYPDIVAPDNSHAAQAHAGNALLQQAYEDLRRGSELQEAYQVVVVPAKYRVWPGQTIDISYHKWTADGYHEINIEDTLWVLSVETNVTAAGEVYTVGLAVATVDYYPVFDGLRQAQEINAARSSRGQSLPESGLTDSNIGNVESIHVKNGKVTHLIKKPAVIPYPDGAYPVDTSGQMIGQITIQDGRIIDIWIKDNPI